MTRAQIQTYRDAGVITDRQADVLLLRARGMSQYAVALALDCSRSNVRYLEQNANRKIELHRRKEAA